MDNQLTGWLQSPVLRVPEHALCIRWELVDLGSHSDPCLFPLAAAAAATLAAKEGEFLASFVLCMGTP